MLEAMKSLGDKMLSFKKASESNVVKTSDSAQAGPKPGTSDQPDPILTRTSNSRTSDHSDVQPMDTEHYGPPFPHKSSQNVQSEHASKQSDIESDHSERCSELDHPQVMRPKQRSILIKENTSQGQNIIVSRLLQRKMSPLLQLKSLQNLNLRFLKNLNIRTAQIQSFIGR